MSDADLDRLIRTGEVTGGYSQMFHILVAAGKRERDRRGEAARVAATIAEIHAEADRSEMVGCHCDGTGEVWDWEECGGAPVARRVACPCGRSAP